MTTEALLDAEVAALFAELETKPVINVAGAYTLLGGSQLSPVVRAAMDAANRYFADMKALFESSGRVIADMLGVEAAFVTSGGAGALALSVAACLTRGHPEYFERLPDTQGIPNQVLVQKSTRQKYDRCADDPRRPHRRDWRREGHNTDAARSSHRAEDGRRALLRAVARRRYGRAVARVRGRGGPQARAAGGSRRSRHDLPDGQPAQVRPGRRRPRVLRRTNTSTRRTRPGWCWARKSSSTS